MRVVAILAVSNERLYLANCLSHLIANGLDFAIVDNGPADGCAEIIHSSRFAPYLAGYSRVPFTGTFSWEEILLEQQRLLGTIDADWHVLLAPDEIMHSYVPGESLASAISRIDQQGHDVVDFDEFVFLPVDGDYVPEHDGFQPLRHYYYYSPRSPYHMRAWRKALSLSNVADGGHFLSGNEFRLAPETFALRHYIFRDQAHALEKYANRAFAANEIERGWHFDRVGQQIARFVFPPAGELHCLTHPADRNFVRDHPRKAHYWEG
jgi:hypothetical protein